jgi:type IV secretion system protein VirB11
LPPVVTGPTFSIRRHASRLIPLEEYIEVGIMSPRHFEAIGQAIAERRNIVVAGGTGSGKTTLVNAIIAEMVKIAPEQRLVVLEDTAEIQCTAHNSVALHTSETTDMAQLLRSTLRLRPDRIIVGEVRDGAALTLLKAWNTGHPGGVTTVHANSALSALRRLEQLTAEVSHQPLREVIAEAVDLVISVERTTHGRRVHEVLYVDGLREGQYRTAHVTARDDNDE